MNDKQILELVAKTPRISASELASALGVDLKPMSDALRCLVDVGDLAKSIRFDESNGRQCQVYELSEEFRRSRAGRDLIVGVQNEAAAPVPAQTGTVEHVEEVVLSPAASHVWAAEMAKAPVEPKREPAAAPAITKAGRAVAFLREHGSATSEQLRKAMDVDSVSYVSTYLAKARKNGLLHSADGLWKLGADPVETPKLVEVEKLAAQPAPDPQDHLAREAQAGISTNMGYIGTNVIPAPATPATPPQADGLPLRHLVRRQGRDPQGLPEGRAHPGRAGRDHGLRG